MKVPREGNLIIVVTRLVTIDMTIISIIGFGAALKAPLASLNFFSSFVLKMKIVPRYTH